MELGRALMHAGIKLGRGLAVIVEALLKVSMLKPAQEETMPQCTRPRVIFILFLLFWIELISLVLLVPLFVIVTIYDSRHNAGLCR